MSSPATDPVGISTSVTGSLTYPDIDFATTFPESISYLGGEFTYLLATVTIWLGIQAIILNVFVVCFYFRKRNDTVPMMYTLNSATDLLTGIGSIMLGALFFLQRNHTSTALMLVFPAYSIFCVTFKVSVFLNLTIAIARTINIVRPFLHLNNGYICIAAAFYAASWTACTLYEVIPEDTPGNAIFYTYLYSPGQSHLVHTVDLTRKQECGNMMMFILIPFILPALGAVACMAIQMNHLLRKMVKASSRPSKTQRDITTTILLITLLFFFCNSVYLMSSILWCYSALAEEKIDVSPEFNRRRYQRNVATGIVAPIINAAFSPFILIYRGAALKTALFSRTSRLTMSTDLSRSTLVRSIRSKWSIASRTSVALNGFPIKKASADPVDIIDEVAENEAEPNGEVTVFSRIYGVGSKSALSDDVTNVTLD